MKGTKMKSVTQAHRDLIDQLKVKLEPMMPEGRYLVIIKRRYFAIHFADQIQIDMIDLGVDVLSKPVLSFRYHQIYPLQIDQLNSQQQDVLNQFIIEWKDLNQELDEQDKLNK